MKINAMTATSLLILAMSTPLVGTAFAQSETTDSDVSEEQILAATKISASEAIASVEAASGGKVVEFTLDMDGNVPNYQVTVLAPDGKESSYLVDAVTGAATIAPADQPDTEQGMDQGEGNGEGQDEGSGGAEDAN
ncbi:MAG: PepSY domain-containing protein [Cypionkella sp.]